MSTTPSRRIRFTKMQGAGNDFVVLDETQGLLNLTPAQYRFLGDRHFGVGADQILSVRPSPGPGIDFAYAIHNNDGGEVEHCGNGARCFVRYAMDHQLTDKRSVRVQTMNRVLQLTMGDDGRVTVDMGAPEFELPRIPFNPAGLRAENHNNWQKWPLASDSRRFAATYLVAVLSMGNPHAVLLVDDAEATDVAGIGQEVQAHPAFPQGVNVGFMQVDSRNAITLRVYERGAGETLACGTGACAAVVAGIRLGLLEAQVQVHTHGGLLGVEWQGGSAPVLMTGPATTVFEGEIDVPTLA